MNWTTVLAIVMRVWNCITSLGLDCILIENDNADDRVSIDNKWGWTYTYLNIRPGVNRLLSAQPYL